MKQSGGILVLFLLLGAGVYWLTKKPTDEQEAGVSLTIHCAAGLRDPVEQIAEEYEKTYGENVHLNFGGSGELYGKLKISGGDLYIPADRSYTQKALDEELLKEEIPFAQLTAGLFVKKNNPKEIYSLSDLTRPDVRVVFAEKSAAVGKFTHEVLQQANVLEKIKAGSYSTSPTVNAVATQVAIGAADVGIIWDCISKQYPTCKFIQLPEFKENKIAAIGLLEKSKHPQEANKLACFFTGERGMKIFRDHGFSVIKKSGK